MFHRITKNNGVTKDCFLISEAGSDISPSVYIEDYYRAFLSGMSLREIAEKITKAYKECKESVTVDANSFCEYEKVKNALFCRMINREKNKKLLENVPFVPYLDLAVVFYYALEDERFGNAMILIYSEHMQFWNITEEMLWEQARENTRTLAPARIYSISDMLKEMFVNRAAPDDDLDLQDVKIPMYILTNDKRQQGAAAILYDQVLQEAAQSLGDFYVLPSSVHECILVPVEDSPKPEDLMNMVYEINHTQVPPEEVLSDNIYHYDAKKHHLTMVERYSSHMNGDE